MLNLSQRLMGLSFTLYLLGALWWEVFATPSIVQLGSYNLSVSDPAFIAVVLTLLVSAVMGKRVRAWGLISIALVLMLLLGFNLTRGLLIDPFAAFIWLRGDGAIAPILMVALLVEYNDALARRINVLILVTSAFIGLLLLARICFSADLFMAEGGLEINEGRPLSVHGAVILGIASGILMASAFTARYGRLNFLGAVGCLLLVVLSGQATATLCAVVIAIITFGFSEGRLFQARIMSSVLIFACGLSVVSTVLPNYTGASGGALHSRVQNLDNREAIWEAMLSEFRDRSATDQLVGVPAGYIPEIFAKMSFGIVEWQLSLHSMYIGLLSRFGEVGLAAYIALILFALLRLAFFERVERMRRIHTRGLCIAFLIAGLVLGYSYELRGEELILLVIPLLSIGAGRLPRAEDPLTPDATAQAPAR